MQGQEELGTLMDEALDPVTAARCAQRDPRQPGVPHHHFRCDWVQGDWPGTKRCRLTDGHQGDHIYEEEK